MHTPEEIMAAFMKRPLEFSPGDRWSYTNSGYVLAGLIVERVTGLTYQHALRRYLLDPLELSDTGYDTGVGVARLASGYVYQDSAWIRAPYVDPSVVYSAGMLYSTARDLWSWARALDVGTVFVEAATADLLIGPHVATPTPLGGYGYGVFNGELTIGARRLRVLQHGGTMPGFTTAFWRIPAERLTLVLLDNGMSNALPGLIADLAAMVLAGSDR